MRLDLKTILKFQQQGIEGEAQKRNVDKKEYFRRLLNKSF